jgi:hypothetical protein
MANPMVVAAVLDAVRRAGGSVTASAQGGLPREVHNLLDLSCSLVRVKHSLQLLAAARIVHLDGEKGALNAVRLRELVAKDVESLVMRHATLAAYAALTTPCGCVVVTCFHRVAELLGERLPGLSDKDCDGIVSQMEVDGYAVIDSRNQVRLLSVRDNVSHDGPAGMCGLTRNKASHGCHNSM